jgi:hypothetical protein
MSKAIRFALQALSYALFMAVVWYFSFSPPFRQLEPDQAVITLAFAHAGERREECRALSPEEMAKLPPNMRRPADCPRERSPIVVDLLLNGEPAIKEVANAPGLYSDQGVSLYRRVKVPAGEHLLSVSMNDNVRVEGPTFTHEQRVNIKPGQMLVVDFDSDERKFVIK